MDSPIKPALDCDQGSGNDALREIFTHKFVAHPRMGQIDNQTKQRYKIRYYVLYPVQNFLMFSLPGRILDPAPGRFILFP